MVLHHIQFPQFTLATSGLPSFSNTSTLFCGVLSHSTHSLCTQSLRLQTGGLHDTGANDQELGQHHEPVFSQLVSRFVSNCKKTP